MNVDEIASLIYITAMCIAFLMFIRWFFKDL